MKTSVFPQALGLSSLRQRKRRRLTAFDYLSCWAWSSEPGWPIMCGSWKVVAKATLFCALVFFSEVRDIVALVAFVLMARRW